jgi:hypothetical protein
LIVSLIIFINQERDSQTIDQNMLVPPNASGTGGPGNVSSTSKRHRRLSSLNTVSWPNPNELTVSPRQRRMSTVASSEAQDKDVMHCNKKKHVDIIK